MDGTSRAELMTFQQGEELKERFDRLIGLLGEEIEIYPDILRVGIPSYQQLAIGNNSAMSFDARWEVIDRESGRWLQMRLRDPLGTPILIREWRCVFHPPDGGPVVDRPSFP